MDNVVTERSKKYNILTQNFEADGDLSSLQYCGVTVSGDSSGSVKIKAPTGQGTLTIGILQNAPEDGELGEVLQMGVSKVKANGSFNSGEELTVGGTAGTFEAAASGDYVVAIALEAASAANHTVSALIITPYQLN